MLAPLGSFSRARTRQRARRRLLVLALTLPAVAAAVYGAYEAGRAQLELDNGRLRAENGRLEALDRERTQRLVEALARVEVLEARNRELEAELAQRLPNAEIQRLVELLQEKRRAGVPVERLASVLAAISRERDCRPEAEPPRVWVAVPLVRDRRNHVSLADGRITLRLSGEPARDAEGRPQAWYDAAGPVRLDMVSVAGERFEMTGILPLARTVVVAGREYRILVQPDERRGYARLAVESCAWP